MNKQSIVIVLCLTLFLAYLSGCLNNGNDKPSIPTEAIINTITIVPEEGILFSYDSQNTYYEGLSNWKQLRIGDNVPMNTTVYVIFNMIFNYEILLDATLEITCPNGTKIYGQTDWQYSYIGQYVTNNGPGFYFTLIEPGYYDLVLTVRNDNILPR